MRQRGWLVVLTLVLVGACGGKSPRHATIWKQSDQLGEHLTGSFVLEADGVRTKGRLHIRQVWHSHEFVWLYAEWLHADTPNKPRDQLVLGVMQVPDRTAGLALYRIPAAVKYAGAWHDPRKLADLKPADLLAQEGCTIAFDEATRERMIGHTMGDSCPDVRAGTHRTIRVEVTRDRLVWTERTFDAQGHQVGGALQAGDTYVKTANSAYR